MSMAQGSKIGKTLTAEDRQILAAATAFHRQRLGIAPQVIPRRSILTALAAAIAVVFGGKGARK